MKPIKNVLVTGSNGYIGSILTPLLEGEVYNVTGLDTGYFDYPQCQFKKHKYPVRILKKDIRHISREDL